MSWWWAGAIGAVKKRQDEHAPVPSYQSVALIAGATGIVGNSLLDILPLEDTPGGPWKVYALSRHPRPTWSPPTAERAAVEHIQCDLTDAAAVDNALRHVTDITHVFYVTWTKRPTEDENRAVNGSMLRNLLTTVLANAKSLVHVCLQTGREHYLGRFDNIGQAPGHESPFTEDVPRLDTPNFYYDLEDILVEEIGKHNPGVSWSVHRPATIFGFSPKSAMNIIGTLCAYAAICRKEGTELRWPGGKIAWEGFSDASDADLVAEQQIWASVEVNAKNNSFNCSNGDVFKWKHLWPILAQQFGVAWRGYEGEEGRFKLSEAMAGKEELWQEIVAENGLTPTKLGDVGNWWFADFLFSVDGEHLDSMNKSKEHGFLGFRNTTSSFRSWIAKSSEYKIVP